MDLAARALARLTPEGWALLEALPPYDEAGELATAGERLRERRGHDAERRGRRADPVPAAARGRGRSSATFADGMLFTADGLEQATRLRGRGPARPAVSSAPASRACTTSAAASGPTRWRSPALDSRSRRRRRPVTAAVADRQPAALAGRARSGCGRRRGRRPSRRLRSPASAVWLDPARRTPRRADVARADPAGLPARRDLAAVVVRAGRRRAGAGDRGQALAVVAARRHPARRRGAVDLVGRRGARVRGVVGPARPTRRSHGGGAARDTCAEPVVIEVDETLAADHPGLASLHALGAWLYEPDRAVTQAGPAGALVAAPSTAELDTGLGYVTTRPARDESVGPALRVARGDAVSTEARCGPGSRPRRRPA